MRKFHPILFSTPMVQAILEGRKTMTRRAIKQKDQPWLKDDKCILEFNSTWEWVVKMEIEALPARYEILQSIKCPYGNIGDVLWVRETTRKYYYVDEYGYTNFDDERVDYATDNPEPVYQLDGNGCNVFNKDGSEKIIPWTPSIFMPKAACRIFLEITDIKVERLQDISEEDAIAEGVLKYENAAIAQYEDYMGGSFFYNPQDSFLSLWEKINGAESLEANPFVWVIEFKRIEKPANFNQ